LINQTILIQILLSQMDQLFKIIKSVSSSECLLYFQKGRSRFN